MGLDRSCGDAAWYVQYRVAQRKVDLPISHRVPSPECAYGMQVKIYGDAATKARESEMLNERALWIANHRTRIDWMLMWSVALRTGTLASLRIILKAPLRKIPIFGWAMQHFIFVFLVRPLACS